MSEIETLLDCEDAINEIAQAQVILELLDRQISEHYGSLGKETDQVLNELGYILNLYRDQEIRVKLLRVVEVMGQDKHNTLDLREVRESLNRQIEES
jgi:predicted site-specific integrase-resolvase